ncbi:EXLDI protein [Streptococcus macacae]|uniref:EXLDI protein n=1 Tax=Streptococcus macacae NCTC 11558 TaxID=764298 RepID=G5JWK9_9STRE|nr:EXLDI protein [Streptococcus macacae]EHJ52597.1 hypothetical protein STRMA_0981 [Streptococcus macacae NCTC 11558]SUN78793.1 Uncharacterised protein [Streptococcus macacae NCTC 11558]
MTYKEIKLSFFKDGIRSKKIFHGMKLYSHTIKSMNGQWLVSRRVYLTEKGNYVYYERRDVNWHYWDGEQEGLSFDPSQTDENNIFEVASDLEAFAKYLGEDIIEKLAVKVQNGEIIEYLDI